MPSNRRYHSAKSARTAWKVTEKAAVGLARWVTTDHTGTAKLLPDDDAQTIGFEHQYSDLSAALSVPSDAQAALVAR